MVVVRARCGVVASCVLDGCVSGGGDTGTCYNMKNR